MVQTLAILNFEEYKKVRRNIMGCSVLKNTPDKVRIYDNWVNRITLGKPIPIGRYEKRCVRESDKDKLYDFQKEDVQRMASNEFFLNRNKMGSGKTIEFIATCRAVDARSILVVCLKPTLAQWREQFKKWWPERADDIKVYEFGYTPKNNDIILVNPEKLVSAKSNGKFNQFEWNVLGVDEAHILKNPSTKRTIGIKKIPAYHKYALTGTPVLRSPDDLYSIFGFLSPMIAGSSYWSFVEFFCNVEEDFFGRHITGLTHNEDHVAILNTMLNKLGCYHEIIVAKGKRHIVVPLDMEPQQKKLYKQVQKLILDELPDTLTIPNGAVRVIRLLQTTSCPAVLAEGCSEDVAEQQKKYGVGVKFEYILDMLETDPEMKIVVYSSFAKVVKQLCNYLNANKVTSLAYTGDMPDDLRNKNKERFTTDSKVRVLAGTIGALGTGVDGLQKSCHVCVFIDRDRRPLINDQCEDRLNRMGQEQEVLVYDLQCEGTYDKHIFDVNLSRLEDIRKILE